MTKRKARKDLKAVLPCVECGKGMQIDVFKVPLYHRKEKSSGYWTNESASKKEVKCGSCGTLQEIMFQAIATKIC